MLINKINCLQNAISLKIYHQGFILIKHFPSWNLVIGPCSLNLDPHPSQKYILIYYAEKNYKAAFFITVTLTNGTVKKSSSSHLKVSVKRSIIHSHGKNYNMKSNVINKSSLMRKYCYEKEEKDAINPFLNNPKIMLRCSLDSVSWNMTSHFFIYPTNPDYTKAIMRKCVIKQQVMLSGIEKTAYRGKKRSHSLLNIPKHYALGRVVNIHFKYLETSGCLE